MYCHDGDTVLTPKERMETIKSASNGEFYRKRPNFKKGFYKLLHVYFFPVRKTGLTRYDTSF